QHRVQAARALCHVDRPQRLCRRGGRSKGRAPWSINTLLSSPPTGSATSPAASSGALVWSGRRRSVRQAAAAPEPLGEITRGALPPLAPRLGYPTGSIGEAYERAPRLREQERRNNGDCDPKTVQPEQLIGDPANPDVPVEVLV